MSPAHRPTVMARRGLVAAGHPLGAQAGLSILQKGGNAVDAAVAAAAVMAVVNPAMSGLGGDVFMLIHSAAERRIVALNGSGAAPRGVAALAAIPAHGTGAATVPGTVAGWADAARRYGTMDLRRLLDPAIAYADEGVPVGARLARHIAEHASLLAEVPAAASIFLPGGRPPEYGDVLVQRDLARTLRLIAREGAAAFYGGDVATVLERSARDHGGYLTAEDLAHHQTIWAEPIRTTYRDREVVAQPPVSQGLILLEELNIVEDDDLTSGGLGEAERIHVMVEANKLAFADRDRYLGDPEFVEVPLSRLLAKSQARALRKRIDPRRALRSTRASVREHTTYLATADRDSNAVSLIQSLFSEFGCGVVVDGTGVLLNNRLAGFVLDAASPNQLRPGKRPVHTLNNCIVLNEGRPEFVLGSPGTDGQVQFAFQLLVNLLDRGLELQEAVEAPRWRSEPDGTLKVEARVDPEVQGQLRALGHRVLEVEAWAEEMGGAQAIRFDHARGVLWGAADPRREGYAVGW